MSGTMLDAQEQLIFQISGGTKSYLQYTDENSEVKLSASA